MTARNLPAPPKEPWCKLRGDRLSMTSLYPVLTISRQLTERLVEHRGMTQAQANARAVEIIDHVGLGHPNRRLQRYPHELSGGQRQQVMIAMATEPDNLTDVSVQTQVLERLREPQRSLGLACPFISHNMAVDEAMAHRVAVMPQGLIVQMGPRQAVLDDPRHIDTRTLPAAEPIPDPQAGGAATARYRQLALRPG